MIDTVKKTLPVFLGKHANYTVVEEIEQGRAASATRPQLAAGDAPDVMAICCWGVPVWAEQGLLASLDPLLKRDGKELPIADFAPLLMSYWTLPQSGGLFALPMSAYTRGMYYNRNYFKRKGIAPPDANWDWNEDPRHRSGAERTGGQALGLQHPR